MEDFGEFHSSLGGDFNESNTGNTNKKLFTELSVFLVLLLLFFIIVTPWALPRIRYMVNPDFYKVIDDENFGFCTDSENGSDVFRGNKCAGGRCSETFYDAEGEVLKAYNYDEGHTIGSEERFVDCSNTSYFFFEKHAPSGL